MNGPFSWKTALVAATVTLLAATVGRADCTLSSCTFSSSAQTQSFTVPAGTDYIVVTAWGAGGGSCSNAPGCSGDYVCASYNVTGGQTCSINVGCGGSGGGSHNGGWPDGGSCSYSDGGGGGGSSIVTTPCGTVTCSGGGGSRSSGNIWGGCNGNSQATGSCLNCTISHGSQSSPGGCSDPTYPGKNCGCGGNNCSGCGGGVVITCCQRAQAQTITFPNPGSQIVGGAPALSATASSGLAVSYSITSGPATLSGSKVNCTGTGAVTVAASQAGNSSYLAATPVSVTFQVNAVPAITSPLSASGDQNEAFSYTIAATNGATTFGATGLPAGLSCNSSTGAISGSPTQAGTSTVTITASNANGTGSATLSLTVAQTYSLTITASPSAGGYASGAGTYVPGTVVSISETANNGYRTNGWGGANGGNTASPTSASTTIVMSANRTLTAQFVQQATLTVTNNTGGTASGSGTYDVGSAQPITATPSSGYVFTNWSGSGIANANSAATTVTISGNQIVTASFGQPPAFTSGTAPQSDYVGQSCTFQVTATNSPTFSATGLPSGLSINSSGLISGTPTHTGTSTATITAANSVASVTETLSFTVANPPTITSALTATADQNEPFAYTITAGGGPTGFSATGLPAGLAVSPTTGVISGSPTQSGSFPVTISAGVAGQQWPTATLTITVTPTYTLTITPSNANGGTATGAGIYPAGTTVAISETANSGYRAAGWSGPDGSATASPTSPSTTITMSANRSLIANFPQQVTLTVTTTGGGTATGSGTYDAGSTVPIAATPGQGNIFVGWSGSGVANLNSAATSVTISGNEIVTASFLAPPVLNAILPQVIIVGQPYALQATATNSPTFSGSAMPPGLSVNTSGAINGPATQAGSYTGTLTAANAAGSASEAISYTVYAVPTVAGASVNGTVGQALSYPVVATGSPTAFAATGLPAGLSINATSGVISGTPTVAGTFPVTVTASNPGASGSGTITISVVQMYSLAITGSPAAGGSFTGAGSYPAGTTVTITETPASGYRTAGWGGANAGSTASPASASTTIVMSANRTLVADFVQQGVLTVTAGSGGTASGSGSYDLGSTATITATPAQGNAFVSWSGSNLASTASSTTTVNITGSETVTASFLAPPVLTAISPQVLVVGQVYSLQAAATNSPAFSGSSLPPGLSVSSSGAINGPATQSGSYTGTIKAANAAGSASESVSFVVYPVPTVTAAAVNGTVGQSLSYPVVATGSPTSFTAVGLPSGLSINASSGVISGTPATAGTFPVTVTASNPGASGSGTITISVVQMYSLTVSAGTGGTATGGGSYAAGSNVAIAATPSQGNAFVSWPGPNLTSATSATTTVNLTGNETVTASFLAPPVLTAISPQVLVVGQAYSLQAAATNSPAFSGSSLPPGLSVSSSGAINGPATQSGSYTGTIKAANAAGSASESVSFVVYPVPTVTAAAVNGTVGQSLSYPVVATGSPTSFTAVGLPSGLSINASSGVISGTPATAGTFPVTVTASNPGASGSGTITISVVQMYSLAITGSPAAGGSFTGAGSYPAGTTVTITETPASGYRTAGWGGVNASSTASSTSASTTIVMSANRTLVADFVQQATLTVTSTGGGTASGSGTYDVGSTVSIGATPGQGNVFVSWSGSGVANLNSAATSVTISGNEIVTASFLAPPVLNAILPQVIIVGQPYALQATATNSPTFGGASLPPGLAVTSSGAIDGPATQAGTYTGTLTATNAAGSASENISFTVYAVPTVASASVNSTVGQSLSYSVVATGSPTNFTATGLPSGLFISPSTGAISGTPSVAGTFPVTVTASNPGASGSGTITITVVQMYSLAIAGSPSAGGSFTGTGSYPAGTVVAIDESPNSSYRAAGWGGADGASTASPTSASTTIVMSANRSLIANFVQQGVLTVNAGAGGTATGGGTYDVGSVVAISATPSQGNAFVGWSGANLAGPSSASTTVTVTGDETVTASFLAPPVLTAIPAQILVVGQPYAIQASATNGPTFSATGMPPGLSIDNSGNIGGPATQAGSYAGAVTATNAAGSASESVSFAVYAVPTVADAMVSATVGQSLSYSVVATGSPTNFTATGLPSGLSIDPAAGTISGTPTVAGTFPVTVTASNPGASGSGTITISVIQMYTLAITGSPLAGGSFTGAGSYPAGTIVTINETANNSYRVAGWGGTDASATASPTSASTTIVMSADRSLVANFVQQGLLIVNAGAGGTATGGGTYDVGTVVAITATPANQYQFNNWTGAATANASLLTTTVTVTGNETVTANFSQIPQPPTVVLTAASTAFTGSPFHTTAVASAPDSNLTLQSIEWLSPTGTWTVSTAAASGASGTQTAGITFPSTGVWSLRAGASVDNGNTWVYSPTVLVTVSSGITTYTLETMAVPAAGLLNWYSVSPVVQKTYQVQHVNP